MNMKDLKERLEKVYGLAPRPVSLRRVLNRVIRMQPGGNDLLENISTLEYRRRRGQPHDGLASLYRERSALIDSIISTVTESKSGRSQGSN